LTLQDGTIAAGSVAAILPALDLSTSPHFTAYAALLARMQKANARDKYIEIVTRYQKSLPAGTLRGLFGDILGVVGTGVGALFGGVGAPIGGMIGGMAGGWIDGQMSQPPPSGGYRPPTSVAPPFYAGAPPFMQNPTFPPVFSNFPSPSFLPMIPPMPQMYPFPNWNTMMQAPPTQWAPPMYMPMPVMW
jgi:hypothetical protein